MGPDARLCGDGGGAGRAAGFAGGIRGEGELCGGGGVFHAGALALDEEVQLSIHIKQYIQTWYPFRPGEERLAFCAETYKARFEGTMFWEREITGRDPEREGEQETITISGQQAPEEMGTAGLEEEDDQ